MLEFEHTCIIRKIFVDNETRLEQRFAGDAELDMMIALTVSVFVPYQSHSSICGRRYLSHIRFDS